jgi:uncharacterized protein (TIGR03382 family)
MGRPQKTHFFLMACAAGLIGAPAFAQTAPGEGAFPLPPTVDLSWPFEAGESVFILAGYGPTAGSSLHRDRNATHKANDHFALDLTLPEYPQHGQGQVVVAPWGGTVVRAGWATSGWANYGLRVILQHDDPGDGQRYTSVYAHLDRVDVAEGQQVTKGEVLGTLGRSCQGALSCSSFSTPHLHWVIHRNSSVGGSGTGGSYAGNAVVPEVIDGATHLLRGQTHVSLNHGDAPLPPGEPPPLAGPCALLEDELVLEEDGPCASATGPASWWHTESEGSGGRSQWTYAIDKTTPDNTLRWRFEARGAVEVLVAIPAYATSRQARYRLGDHSVVVDQQAHAGAVVSLGTFDVFGTVGVLLEDTTGEPYTGATTSQKLAFDAVIVRPATPGETAPPTDPDPNEDSDPAQDDEDDGAAEDGDDARPADAVEDGDDESDNGEAAGRADAIRVEVPPSDVAGGCATTTAPGLWPFALLGLGARRRRR